MELSFRRDKFNMDMVYPWDRGTNYAIELGEKMADVINMEK